MELNLHVKFIGFVKGGGRYVSFYYPDDSTNDELFFDTKDPLTESMLIGLLIYKSRGMSVAVDVDNLTLTDDLPTLKRYRGTLNGMRF